MGRCLIGGRGWLIVIAVTFSWSAEAQAQPGAGECDPASVGCHVDDQAAWHYRNAAFADVAVDTGWVPPGAPIQLRFQLSFGGSTEVDLEADVVTEWPPALAVSVPGDPDGGRLAINYGLELAIQLRFDVNVAGIRYRWEGDIPVPGIPEDLRAAAEGMFDPFLLPPTDRPFWVGDTTDRVEVVRYDALGGIIPIPGVGGGIAVTVQGDLQTSYQTLYVVMNDASPIEIENAFTVVSPDPGETDYGPAKELLIHPEGVLNFNADIVLAPILYLSFAGTRRDFPLVEVPITIADELVDVIFEDRLTHVPLPDLRLSGNAFALGEVMVGDSAMREVVIDNVGEAPLEINLSTSPGPFAADTMMLTIPPGGMGSFHAVFSPTEDGPVTTVLTLETNDPDEAVVVLRLMGTGVGEPMPDASMPMADGGMGDAGMVPDEGGCGCRVPGAPGAGGQTGPGLLVAFLVLAASLRRRL